LDGIPLSLEAVDTYLGAVDWLRGLWVAPMWSLSGLSPTPSPATPSVGGVARGPQRDATNTMGVEVANARVSLASSVGYAGAFNTVGGEKHG
jgi:hypothetical protein